MALRPPSLRAIAAFEAAARHESFSKAALELNLTQGAVSHAVCALEARLNLYLFERKGRRLALTEDGRVFAGRVRLSLDLLANAFESRPWLDRNCLNISALPVFARRFLGPRLGRLTAAFPDIQFRLSSSWDLADIGGVNDVGLRYGPGGWSGLSAVKIAEESMIAVASPAYCSPLPQAPADLLAHELIGHREFPWAPWLSLAGLEASEPCGQLWLTDSDLLIDAAVSGAGIALVRSFLVQRELADGTLVRLFDIEQPAPYSYWMVWNPTTPKLDLVDRFRLWLTREAERLSEPGPQ